MLIIRRHYFDENLDLLDYTKYRPPVFEADTLTLVKIATYEPEKSKM